MKEFSTSLNTFQLNREIVLAVMLLLGGCLLSTLLGAYYGFHFSDLKDNLALGHSPFNLLPNYRRQFLHGSVLNILMVWGLGANTEKDLKIIYACLMATSWISFLLLSLTLRKKPLQWLTYVLAILATPLLHVLLSWLGKSDPLFFIGFLLLHYLKSPAAKGLGAFILLTAHKELGCLVLLVDFCLDKERTPQNWRYILGGLPSAY